MSTRLTPPERWVLSKARVFATPDARAAVFQLLNTLLPLAGLLWLLTRWPSVWLGVMVAVPLGGLVVRTFVLQHDAGHHSFLPDGLANDLVGAGLSIVTGVPYEAWRTEHRWHHSNQGKLHARGVDRVNSPMTAREAQKRPDLARQRADTIQPWRVLLLGAAAILITRKTAADFFMFRPDYPEPLHNTAGLVRSVRLTVAAHLALHALLAVWIGPLVWLVTAAVAWSIAGICGALLFWVQHNVERSWHAGPRQWHPVRVALHGASHLRLPRPLRWLTADIGLHHVHHLNMKIPNYSLRRAHFAIPELHGVPALTRDDIKAAFTHVFWDDDRGRMVPLEEALRPAVRSAQQ